MRLAVIRWILAAVFLAVGVKHMSGALRMEGFAGAGRIIMSMIACVSAVILVAPETAVRLAEWCARPFTNILVPSDEYRKPPLSYLLARRYRDELRHEESIAEYENIIHHYPRERQAYIELMEIVRQTGDEKRAKKYEALFRKRFKEEVP